MSPSKRYAKKQAKAQTSATAYKPRNVWSAIGAKHKGLPRLCTVPWRTWLCLRPSWPSWKGACAANTSC